MTSCNPLFLDTQAEKPVRFLSLFSGIEAASVAWEPLGWECVGVAEIEPFPCVVLAHHYPSVPNLGDVTKITEEQIKQLGEIDLVVGGFPCQDLSVAGKRKGLTNADGTVTRSGLFFTGLNIFNWAKLHCSARFLLLENVPGLFSSNKGRDFGTMVECLAGLDEVRIPAQGWGSEGVAVGDNGLLEWCSIDAQWFGLAQRRRRVFALLDTGDWANRPSVLLEPESLRGDTAPSRKTGQNAADPIEESIGSRGVSMLAPTIPARTRAGGGLGTDFDCDGGLIASTGNTSHCLNAGGMGRQDYETETLIAHTLRAEGFDSSEDGTGRGTPLVPVHPYTLAIRGRGGESQLEYRQDGTANAILTPNGGRSGMGVGALAFQSNQSSANVSELMPTLRASTGGGQYDQGVLTEPKAFAQNTRDEVRYIGGDGNVAGALAAQAGMKQQSYIQQVMAVRRITVTEAERLQGFADGYTNVPFRGKPAADGNRYKALGNSMATTCMFWLGYRINKAFNTP